MTIELRVRDTGCGISAANQEKLFRHFGRLDDPQGQNRQGVGLGLTICSQIVMLYGGSIDVESEEGQGTSVVVTLKTPSQVTDAALQAYRSAIDCGVQSFGGPRIAQREASKMSSVSQGI